MTPVFFDVAEKSLVWKFWAVGVRIELSGLLLLKEGCKIEPKKEKTKLGLGALLVSCRFSAAPEGETLLPILFRSKLFGHKKRFMSPVPLSLQNLEKFIFVFGAGRVMRPISCT